MRTYEFELVLKVEKGKPVKSSRRIEGESLSEALRALNLCLPGVDVLSAKEVFPSCEALREFYRHVIAVSSGEDGAKDDFDLTRLANGLFSRFGLEVSFRGVPLPDLFE